MLRRINNSAELNTRREIESVLEEDDWSVPSKSKGLGTEGQGSIDAACSCGMLDQSVSEIFKFLWSPNHVVGRKVRIGTG